MAKRSGNKSQAVRDFLQANPDMGPTSVAKALGEQGVQVSAAFVSTVKSGSKKKKSPSGRRPGRPPASASKGTPSTKSESGNNGSTDNLSLSALMEAKKLASQLGGVDKAKRLMDALAKLGS